jgi:tRNA1(Val) A37 N6-methylase TrmN6
MRPSFAMPEPELQITEDRLLGGVVTLLQPRRGHRAGTDAVLLAGLTPVGEKDVVADLGASTGAVGLMVAARVASARLLLVERDPDLVALAARNIALNGLSDRARAVHADLFWTKQQRAEAGLEASSVDLVLTNPPFFEGEGRPSPEPRRRTAHEMEGGGLADWLESASELLPPKGRLGLIYRADGLARCLAALDRRFGSVLVTPIYPRAGEPASRILVGAVKGGKAPLRLAPGQVLHGPDGTFTPEASRLHAAPT